MKLICAPMATLSHPAFRFLCEKFGACDEYYNEMINAPSLLHKGQFEKYYINPAPLPEKIVWQLTGKASEPMIQAAEVLCPLGGLGIDLNMGCCAPEIFNSGAGIAWMLKPLEETRALLVGVKKVLDEYEKNTGTHRRLSVKFRLGDEDFTDEGFFTFADMLVDSGAEQLALHPRTRKERYREKPRWQYAQALAERYKGRGISVVVNGDIMDPGSAERVKKICPDCSALMIGRAAAQKPWIFKQLSGLDGDFTVDMQECGLEFIDWVEQYQPPEFYKTRLQRFFTYFCMNFSFAHYAQTQMVNAKSIEDSRARWLEYFQKVPQDRYKKIL